MRRHAVLQGHAPPDGAGTAAELQLAVALPVLHVYTPDWAEMRDGYHFCTLCNIFATDGHLSSERHKRRQEWHEKSADLPLVPLPEWVEDRGGMSFCILCSLFATEGHLASEKHRRRVEWHEWVQRQQIENHSDRPPASWGDPAHFERRDCWWFCRLCDQWADACHVESKRHKARVEWAEWSGHKNVPALTHGANDSAERPSEPEPWGPGWQNCKPPPAKTTPQHAQVWCSAFSEEHDRTFFYNTETGERVWELPTDIATIATTASQRESSPPTTPGAGEEDMETAVSAGDICAGSWRREWSSEHQQHYFWCEATLESRWEMPEAQGSQDVHKPQDVQQGQNVLEHQDVHWC